MCHCAPGSAEQYIQLNVFPPEEKMHDVEDALDALLAAEEVARQALGADLAARKQELLDHGRQRIR